MKPEEFLFWVVTIPKSADSTFDDICFQTDLRGFALQVLGGLRTENIIMVSTELAPARDRALKVIEHWRMIFDG